MITFENRIFKLDTRSTSYIFKIADCGKLESIHYGAYVRKQSYDALTLKNTIQLGSSVEYDTSASYSLDNVLLEYSENGKGDFRHSPIELIMPDGTYVSDFVYHSHEISDKAYSSASLPTAYGKAQTLTVTLADKKYVNLLLKLSYTVFEDSDVIVRNAVIVNNCSGSVTINKLMSFSLDLPSTYFDIVTLNGSWIKEAHESRVPVSEGIYVNSSTVGASSNRHNPAFMLIGKRADEQHGRVYGFNLIYSGNHYSAIEASPSGTTRVMSGINPHCFKWVLSPRESFEAPQAIMTYSSQGINRMAQNMHSFVNNNIVRGSYKGKERPVVINNWEAMMFKFNRQKIISLADKAKKLGIEMLVLDDGWFGERNDDRAGLGDWVVNTKKLPGGLKSLADAINKRGMKFGLWFEPECVNQDSDLYRAHPDWAISVPSRTPSLGRNQMVLDLTRKEVRDYIVDSVHAVLSSANIEYVKWDYNRHISDMYSQSLENQGEFYHKYILGLYEVLDRIFHKLHPEILFESCSSGGNRFDLGMLCYSPQIWTSDDTDPIERLDIQGGIFNFYPLSTVSAHVSMSPHAQTLRATPLSTRFNVACFGALGYELDFNDLTPDELKQIKAQVEFYKAHRRTFQYGRFEFVPVDNPNQLSWQVKRDGEIIAGLFQKRTCAAPYRDRLTVPSAEVSKAYSVECVKQSLRIKAFGPLINHISPIKLKADGLLVSTVDKHFSMVDGHEAYTCYGDILKCGINLEMQFEGTGYNEKIRLLGDFGSNLYLIKEI
ncbi:MAG: alpha-galactosidase [Clostridia bacterium]|nr:alpha-galactosidase [Clostridia bacterium]